MRLPYKNGYLSTVCCDIAYFYMLCLASLSLIRTFLPASTQLLRFYPADLAAWIFQQTVMGTISTMILCQGDSNSRQRRNGKIRISGDDISFPPGIHFQKAAHEKTMTDHYTVRTLPVDQSHCFLCPVYCLSSAFRLSL